MYELDLNKKTATNNAIMIAHLISILSNHE